MSTQANVKAIFLSAVLLVLASQTHFTSPPADAAWPGPGTYVSRASEDSSGIEGNNYSFNASLSSDGRYVAFDSWASNLVSDDTNGNWDVFRKDLQTGEVKRVSVDSLGGEVSGASLEASISADGRYVAFYSNATGLVPGGSGLYTDVYRKDLDTGEIIRASTDSSGTPVNGDSYGPSLSQDGRYLAFESEADALLGEGGDTNFAIDVFRKDLETGAIERASTDAGGAEVSGDSGSASISSDGRYVVFESAASSLVSGDTNGAYDVFRKDLTTAEVERVSTDALGAEGDFASSQASISAAGDFVAFRSFATNLVSGDDNGTYDIFRKDLLSGAVAIVSADVSGAEGDFDSHNPSVSSDARYVTFTSLATNLVEGDGNAVYDVFRKDLLTAEVLRVSVNSSGSEANNTSYIPSISSDGRYVGFHSYASNLVSGDNNSVGDVFVADMSLHPDAPPPSTTTTTAATTTTTTIPPTTTTSATTTTQATTTTGATTTTTMVISRIEETDAAVSYGSKWKNQGNGEASANKYRWSYGESGESATVAFDGNGIGYVTTKGASLGIARVSIDGVDQGTVDLYSPSTIWQQTVFSASGLTSGGHTMTVEATFTKNPSASDYRITVDAFDISTGGGGTTTTGPTTTTGATTTTTMVTSRIEETDAAVSYGGKWKNQGNGNASANKYRWSYGESGKSATVTFDGTAIGYVTTKGASLGIARVSIDGVDQGTVDLYSPSTMWQQTVFSASGLTSGGHSMTVEATFTKNPSASDYHITVDAFDACQC